MDDSLIIANAFQDPQTLAGLLSSNCLEDVRFAEDKEHVIETAGADSGRIKAAYNKVEAAKRHDKELSRLIAAFVDAYPFYEPIEY